MGSKQIVVVRRSLRLKTIAISSRETAEALPMRYTSFVVGILLTMGGHALAGAQEALHCYGAPTQIGVVARRDFKDDHGFVVKAISYRSAAGLTEQPLCAEESLGVYETRLYERDGLGRVVVETVLDAQSQVDRFARYEYGLTDPKTPSRIVSYGPEGDPRYETRRSGAETSALHIDEHRKVVAVLGAPPAGVDYGIAWGESVDAWRLGIGLARGSVYLNLRNESADGVSALFVFWPDVQLVNGSGLVPLLPAAAKNLAEMPRAGDSFRLVAPGAVAFSTLDLESRYGPLPRGHYSLWVRHPHPVTGAVLRSSQIEFDIR
jgi:hypothetical protein